MKEPSELAKTVDKINDVYSYMFKDTETNEEKSQVARILKNYKPEISFREGLERMQRECVKNKACYTCKLCGNCKLFKLNIGEATLDEITKIVETLDTK